MTPPTPDPLPARTPEEAHAARVRRDRQQRPWLHLPLSRALILVASAAIIMLGLLGTLGYNSFKSQQNSNLDRQQQQAILQLKDILAYITGSKQTQAQTAANQWVVKQIRDICVAFQQRPVGGPPCKLEPLPPLLKQFVNQPPPGSPPTTRAP